MVFLGMLLDSKIDGGNILKQAKIKLDHDETALSLNLKCYSLAIKTFSELVDEEFGSRNTATNPTRFMST